MSIFAAVVVGLLMGIAFGFALEKSRVFEPGMIVGQMQLRNFIMVKMFLTTVVVGLVILAVLHGLGIVKLHPKATIYGADIVGGLILGVGIVIAGACPGTILAQIGAGYRDAWATLIGGILGAMAFGYLEPTLRPVLLSGGPGKLTLDVVLGIPFWILAPLFAAALLACLVALEKWRPWRNDLGANYDGLMVETPPGSRE